MKTSFAPSGADTVKISATATTASAAIDANSSVVRVLNTGPNIAYIQFGRGSATATTAKMPVPVGTSELYKKANADTVAAICDTGNTATIMFTTGES